MTIAMTRKETISIVKNFSSSPIAKNRRMSQKMYNEVYDTITDLTYKLGYILNKDYCFVAGAWDLDKKAYVTSSALPYEMQEEVEFDAMETRVGGFIRYILFGGKEQ